MDIKIKALLLIINTLSLFFFSGNAAGKSFQVEGIILSAAGPLAHSSVYAYPDFSSLANSSNGIKSLPGEKKGQFLLEVKPGTYYLVARGMLNGKKVFAYHGLNPVSLNEDYLWLPFFLLLSQTYLYTKKGPRVLAELSGIKVNRLPEV